MGYIAAVSIAAMANQAANQARREAEIAYVSTLSTKQRIEYGQRKRQHDLDMAALRDRTRAAQMFRAAAKGESGCPWKRFRKANEAD